MISFELENEKDTIRHLNSDVIKTHSQRFAVLDGLDYHKDEDGYAMVYKAENEIVYDDEFYFTYRINSHGYRGDHFKVLDRNNINILYGGCSLTFGEGLPEELTWPYLLTEKIKNQYPSKQVNYYNLSQPGLSISGVSRLCFDYFKKYGHPDYLFLMLPNIMRGLVYSKHQGYKTIAPNMQSVIADPIVKKYFQNVIPENVWLQAFDLMNIIEQYCESVGITLVWNATDREIWKQLNYKFFVNKIEDQYSLIKPKTIKITNELKMPDNILNLPYWECARDGSHPGSAWTTSQAESYYNKIEFKNEKN